MREQKIVIDIEHDGSISADSQGFEGTACLDELEALLEGLAGLEATVKRKPEARKGRRSTKRTVKVGRER